MKKTLIIIIAAILISVFISLNRNNPRVIINRLAKKSEFSNRDLRYRVYIFGLLPIGDATLAKAAIEEYKGQKVYHLTATAKSSRLLSMFFNGLVTLDSYVDMDSFNPLLFKQVTNLSEKKVSNKEIAYDQKNNIMTMDGVRRQILPSTHDPLSALFNIERTDLDKIKELELNINTNQKNYILKGTCSADTFSINRKAYKIFMVNSQIKRRDNNPYHQSKINMVLLKESINIPLLIKVSVAEMFLTIRLIDIE